jgi:hypothetical protein
MRFYVRSVIGLVVFFFAWVCFEYAIYNFLQIGTCASGGPYVSARECPSGVGVYFAAVFGGIIFGLIGVGIYATRGRPPDAEEGTYQGPRIPFGILAWSLLFAGTAVVAIYAIAGPDADPGPGGELGAIIVAAVFLPMGILPLLFFARRGRKPKTTSALGGLNYATSTAQSLFTPSSGVSAPPPPTPQPPPATPRQPMPAPPPIRTHTPGGGAPKEDGLEQLEKLKKLRDSGALTDSEFAAAKAKILADL